MTKEMSPFTSFCIKLGLWNLAEKSNSFEEYCLQWNPDFSVSDITYCINSPLVVHSWQGLWLEIVALRNIYQAKNLEFMKVTELSTQNRVAEFGRLLSFVQDTNSKVAEELWQLFLWRVCAGQMSVSLTDTILNVLCDYLSNNPIYAHFFVSLILPKSPQTSETNDQLLNLYFGVLKKQASIINHCQQVENQNLTHEVSIDNNFLSILSLVCLESNGEKLGDWLYNFINSTTCHFVPNKFIYFCLLTHSKLMLLQYLLIVHERHYYIRYNETSLPTPNNWITSGIVDAEDLFNVTVKFQYHWIESLLDAACGVLGTAEDASSSAAALARWPAPFRRLLPLLLPRLWAVACTCCSSPPEATSRLRRLVRSWQGPRSDAALRRLAVLLERRARLAAWCSARAGHHCARALRAAAADASVLRALSAATDLSVPSLWSDARGLLAARRASFAVSEDEPNDCEDSPRIPWDVTVFDGFCILMNCLRAIQSSMEIEQNCDRSIGNDVDQLKKEEWYQKEVLDKLQETKDTVCHLLPLHFRMEIMENAFALLFMQPVSVNAPSDSDSSVEEGGVDEAARDDAGLESSFASSVASCFNTSEASVPALASRWRPMDSEADLEVLEAEDAATLPPNLEDSLSVVVVGEGSRADSCHSLSSDEGPRTVMCPCARPGVCSCVEGFPSPRAELPQTPTTRGAAFLCGRRVVTELLATLAECAKYSKEAISEHGDEALLQRLRRLTSYIDEGQKRVRLFEISKTEVEDGKDGEAAMDKNGDNAFIALDERVTSAIVDPMDSYYSGGTRCFVSQLLSPWRALAVRCLALGRLDKAQEVALSHQLDPSLNADITFTAGLQRVRARLRREPAPAPVPAPAAPPHPISSTYAVPAAAPLLQSVKQAATEGAYTAIVTKEVSIFMSSTPLPTIPESQQILAEFPASKPFVGESPSSLALADVVLTAGSTAEQSAALLALLGPGVGDSPAGRGSPPGPAAAVRALADAFRLTGSTGGTCGTGGPSRPSLCDLLHSHLHPGRAHTLREHLRFWRSLSERMMSGQEFSESVETDESSESKILPVMLNNILHGDFLQDLIQVISSVDINAGFLLEEEEVCGRKHYLNKLLLYTTYLSTCLRDESSEGGVDVAGAEREKVVMALQSSLRERLGALAWGVGGGGGGAAAPSVEAFSHLVRHNLVHSAARAAWPAPLPVAGTAPRARAPTLLAPSVLNELPEAWAGPTLPPRRAAAALLGALLSALGSAAAEEEEAASAVAGTLSLSGAARALRSPAVRLVLRETAQLARVDLELLASRADALAFCTNVAQLLRTHALLLAAASDLDEDCGDLLARTALARELAQGAVAYTLGGSRVSLHMLQRAAGGSRWALADDVALPPALRRLCRPDGRVLCLLGAGHARAPQMQVLSPEDLDIQLNIAVRDCLKSISLEDGQKSLKLPPMLCPLAGCVSLGVSVSELVDENVDSLFLEYEPPTPSWEQNSSVTALLETWNGSNCNQILQSFLRIMDEDLYLGEHDVTKFLHTIAGVCEFEHGEGQFCLRVRGAPTLMAPNLGLQPHEEVRFEPPCAEAVLATVEPHCWPLAVLLARLLQEGASDCAGVSEELLRRRAPDTRHLRRLLVSRPVSALRGACTCGEGTCAGEGACPGGATACALWLGAGAGGGGAWRLLERLCPRRPLDALAAALLLPERRARADAQLRALRRELLLRLAQGPANEEPAPWTQCIRVDDWAAAARCALLRSPHWPPAAAQRVLRALLCARRGAASPEEEGELRAQLRQRLLRLQVLSKVSVRWAEEHPDVAPHTLQVDAEFVLHLLEQRRCAFADAEQLLRSLEPRRALEACTQLVERAHDVTTVHAAAAFALDVVAPAAGATRSEMELFERAAAGAALLSRLPPEYIARARPLLTRPLLLVEQLLMDAQFETLRVALGALPRSAPHSPLASDAVDSLVRAYAARALECRVAAPAPPVATPTPSPHTTPPPSESASDGETAFRPPTAVPDKNNWMPDYQASECLCCRAVVFSMFNRRHHCRRCGRLVCAGCSTGRMQVTGYGRVPVRVCDECARFAAATEVDADAKGSDAASDANVEGEAEEAEEAGWRLTGDEETDATVRGEFSYAHAPSAALCLAALSAHSDHVSCARFLVGAGEQLMTLVAPAGPAAAPEVDPTLVLRMARALLVAAKLKFARRGLATGENQCDMLLRRADLLALAASGPASFLLPLPAAPAPTTVAAAVQATAALRALRDSLLALERWPLAVHVSTKAELEAGSAWAAWGRACLRAGRWSSARNKFARVLLPAVASAGSGGGGSAGAGTPGVGEAPALMEVVALLLSGTCVAPQHDSTRDVSKFPPIPQKSPEEPLLVSLAALEDVARGVIATPASTSTCAPAAAPAAPAASPGSAAVTGTAAAAAATTAAAAARRECIYYLRTYGGPAALLSFLTGRRAVGEADVDTLAEAVREAREARVDAETFADAVYLRCAREGRTTALHAAIRRDDPTLTYWQGPLERVAAVLARRRLPHTLYRLQLFCGDSMRAALSCLRFYESGARSFSDLAAAERHLAAAEAHLRAHLRQLVAVASPTHAQSEHAANAAPSLNASDKSPAGFGSKSAGEARRVDSQLRALRCQAEAARFLARCEARGARPLALAQALWPAEASEGGGDGGGGTRPADAPPTLLGSRRERLQVATLALLCAKDIDEGFGVAFRIVQDFHLRLEGVTNPTARQLARDGRPADVCRLAACVQQSGLAAPTPLCDDLLVAAARVFLDQGDMSAVEPIARAITDLSAKIAVYIDSHQLKTAYLIAVQTDRLDDIKRIMNEAQRLGQNAIYRICVEKLKLSM